MEFREQSRESQRERDRHPEVQIDLGVTGRIEDSAGRGIRSETKERGPRQMGVGTGPPYTGKSEERQHSGIQKYGP